jgi:hypothetical protein
MDGCIAVRPIEALAARPADCMVTVMAGTGMVDTVADSLMFDAFS